MDAPVCVCVCVSVLQCRRGSGASASLPHCRRGVRAPFRTPGDRIGTYCALTNPPTPPSTASGATHGALCSLLSHLCVLHTSPGPASVCACADRTLLARKRRRVCCVFILGPLKIKVGGAALPGGTVQFAMSILGKWQCHSFALSRLRRAGPCAPKEGSLINLWQS